MSSKAKAALGLVCIAVAVILAFLTAQEEAPDTRIHGHIAGMLFALIGIVLMLMAKTKRPRTCVGCGRDCLGQPNAVNPRGECYCSACLEKAERTHASDHATGPAAALPASSAEQPSGNSNVIDDDFIPFADEDGPGHAGGGPPVVMPPVGPGVGTPAAATSVVGESTAPETGSRAYDEVRTAENPPAPRDLKRLREACFTVVLLGGAIVVAALRWVVFIAGDSPTEQQIGWVALLVGAVYVSSGIGIKRRSRLALGIASGLTALALAALLILVWRQPPHVKLEPVIFLPHAALMLILIPMIRAFPAIGRLRAACTGRAPSRHEAMRIATVTESPPCIRENRHLAVEHLAARTKPFRKQRYRSLLGVVTAFGVVGGGWSLIILLSGRPDSSQMALAMTGCWMIPVLVFCGPWLIYLQVNAPDSVLSKELSRFGDPDDVAASILEDIARPETIQVSAHTVTTGWYLHFGHPLVTIRLKDIVWAYESHVTSNTDSAGWYLIIVEGNGELWSVRSSGEETTSLLPVFASRAPGVIVGYDPHLEMLWQHDRKSFAENVRHLSGGGVGS